MQINYTGHDIEITAAMKNIIEKKFSRVEKHFHKAMTSANIILTVQKLNNIAEVTVHVKGAEINAKADADDMYKAIDMMMDKLNRQLIKHKEKSGDH